MTVWLAALAKVLVLLSATTDGAALFLPSL
jgi:hypothetical protein